MSIQALNFLQRLVNPLAFHLSSVRRSSDSQAVFSLVDALEAPTQILIVPDSRSGGLFLGASQFWAIRNRYPEARLCLLVHTHKEYIAREIPFIDEVIVYEDFLLPVGGRLREALRQLREKRFDLAFCFSDETSFCPAYLCYKSGSRIRIGFQRKDFPFFNIRIVPRPEPCYELQRLSLLLRTLGIPQVKERVSWSISEEGAQKIQNRFLVGRKKHERFVALDVSSSLGDRPGPKQLQAIAEFIVTQSNTRVLVFFDYAQRKIAQQIKEALSQDALLFQTDDLPKIVALLEACELLISCNSDLFHLAVAMGLSVTGFFDSHDMDRWVPPTQKGVQVFESETVKTWTPHQIQEVFSEP
ncbi:MAG: hypothetical protein O7G87_00515 [bacterium]|nr:hypothetical protein [bacterium]